MCARLTTSVSSRPVVAVADAGNNVVRLLRGPSCAPCDRGTFNNETGQTACITCQRGTFANLRGQTACTPPGRTSTLSLASTRALPLCPCLSPSHAYARAVSASSPALSAPLGRVCAFARAPARAHKHINIPHAHEKLISALTELVDSSKLHVYAMDNTSIAHAQPVWPLISPLWMSSNRKRRLQPQYGCVSRRVG
jgi:hypothetical protein